MNAASMPLDTTPENLAQLKLLISQTLNPNPATIKAAEQQLKELEKRPGYVRVLLSIVETEKQQQAEVLGAAILFKNYVRKYWDEETAKENGGTISNDDRNIVKAHIVNLMCTLPRVLQSQLAEVVRIISKHDYPENWQSLLPDVVSKLGTNQDNMSVVLGLLETLNVVLKMFRGVAGTDELRLKLKYSLEHTQEPILKLFQLYTKKLGEGSSDVVAVKAVLSALRLLARIYYSLNDITIPEYFEDHIAEWHECFHNILNYENAAVQGSTTSDEASPVEKLQAAVLENISLYNEKYSDEFEAYLQPFTKQAWELLQKFGKGEKFDHVVSKGMTFLGGVVNKPYNKKLFEPAVLEQICQRIVIPNLLMRESDMERFEMDPIEYIRRDVEGSNNDTRRKAASDLLRSTCRLFEEEVTRICLGFVKQMIDSRDPIQIDGAIEVIMGIAVRKSLRAKGVTEVNPAVPLLDMFQAIIFPEIMADNINENAILKADALKFVTKFRNQIPKDKFVPLIPRFGRYMAAESFVVHTYAAVAIERMFTITDTVGQGAPIRRYGAPELQQHNELIFTNLFQKLDEAEFGENEYLAKTMMRLIVISKESLVPITGHLIDKFKVILGRVCAAPKNPIFNHYLFESVAALINFVTKGNPQAVAKFEELLFPPFQQILQMEIAEFTPYVYQILGQMLELGADGKLSDAYKMIFGGIFHPDLYHNAGNVPGIVRLIEAYMKKHADETVVTCMSKLLGTVQFLLAKRSTEEMAFKLLVALVEFVDPKHYADFLPPLFNLLFQRLQQSKSRATGPHMTFFILVFVGKHGIAPVLSTFDSVQPGLFLNFVQNVVWKNVSKLHTNTERRACAIGLMRTLSECDALKAAPNVWGKLLVETVKLLSSAGEKMSEDADEYLEIMLQSGYSSSFSKLVYSQTQVRDHFKEIPDALKLFATSIAPVLKANASLKNVIAVELDNTQQQFVSKVFSTQGVSI